MNADTLNDLYKIDVFSPALLTLGTINKIFIIDIYMLGAQKELDSKLTEIFSKSNGIFAGFGIPTLINYF